MEATRLPISPASRRVAPQANAKVAPADTLSPAPVISICPSTRTPRIAVGLGALTIIPAAPLVAKTGPLTSALNLTTLSQSSASFTMYPRYGLFIPTASYWLDLMITFLKSRMWARLSAQNITLGN